MTRAMLDRKVGGIPSAVHRCLWIPGGRCRPRPRRRAL